MDWLKEFAKDDFGRVVITVCGTLLVTAFGVFIGGAKDIFTDWWKRRRLVKYQAMLLATTLDHFITQCVDVIDEEKYEDEHGVVHGTVPNPSIKWPEEIDWPSIPSELMYRCLLLPGRVKAASETAAFVADHVSGPPDYSEYFEELEQRFSEVGLHAAHILDRLKEAYDVQSQDRYEDNPIDIFQRTIAKIKASKEKQRIEQAAMMARMEEDRKKRAATVIAVVAPTSPGSFDRSS
ncbi:hypothetical protein LJR098_001096 [Rhizobium sp. LjRoot98]|uniref:hypothetical protein n=1 Tax=Rhizobium sp. LjRoot98 TaxID=3342345 RepID=UPI003ECFB9B3